MLPRAAALVCILAATIFQSAIALQLQSTTVLLVYNCQPGQERQHYQPLPDLKPMLHCHH
jgi:hypothetical protein